MVAQAIVTARAPGDGKILVRGDSAYGNRAWCAPVGAATPSSPW